MQRNCAVISLLLLCLIHLAVAAENQSHRNSTDRRASSQRVRLLRPSSPDNWLGGTGNWSNGSDWSAGLPGPGSDVSIYTGHDYVTLDTSSSINSLALGGSGGAMTSTLIGDGNAHTLTVAGSLTVGQSGYLQLLNDTVSATSSTNSGYIDVSNASTLQINGNFTNNFGALLSTGFLGTSGGDTLNITGTLTNAYGGEVYILGQGDVANVGQLVNQGLLLLGSGATLNLTNEDPLTDIPLNSIWDINGTFTARGENALQNLTTIEGTLNLGNGQNTSITPNGGALMLSGGLAVDAGSTLFVGGDLNNVGGGIATGIFAGGNTLVVGGNLNMNSSASLQIFGHGDYVIVTGALNNGGIIDVVNAGTLNVDGNVNNAGCIGECGDIPISGGNRYLFPDNFTNEASGVFVTLSDDVLVTAVAVNSGFMRFAPGAGLAAASITLNPGSGLGIGISGPNNFGSLSATGRVMLNGVLDVYLDNGYMPPAGQEFKFLTSAPGGLSGTFSSVQGQGENFIVIYDDSAGYAELVAEGNSSVPEPGSFVLFGSGLLGVAAFVRRKRTG